MLAPLVSAEVAGVKLTTHLKGKKCLRFSDGYLKTIKNMAVFFKAFLLFILQRYIRRIQSSLSIACIGDFGPKFSFMRFIQFVKNWF